MKSEIDEFWSMLRSEDELIRDKGYQRWRNFLRSHPEHFASIKEKLTKNFLTVYQNVNFHDFHIADITCHHVPPKKTEIKLHLFDYHGEYGKNLYFNITYRDVKEYFFRVKSTEHAITWGRDIFEIIEDDLLKHRVLCSDGTSIEIIFKKIAIDKQTKLSSIDEG